MRGNLLAAADGDRFFGNPRPIVPIGFVIAVDGGHWNTRVLRCMTGEITGPIRRQSFDAGQRFLLANFIAMLTNRDNGFVRA